MRYLLAMLSHGHPHSPTAEESLLSFLDAVDQPPDFAVFRHDGPGDTYAPARLEHGWFSSNSQEGFCAATRKLWQQSVREAIDRDINYIFWLEHDFVFTRPLPLRAMALTLRDPAVFQVALIREAINKKEERAGGVYGVHPPSDYQPGSLNGDRWLEHRINFTTNPSLMRTRTMQDNPWPTYEEKCEGNFGLDLLGRGYHFAYWGTGEPWVRHVGPMRTGHSY